MNKRATFLKITFMVALADIKNWRIKLREIGMKRFVHVWCKRKFVRIFVNITRGEFFVVAYEFNPHPLFFAELVEFVKLRHIRLPPFFNPLCFFLPTQPLATFSDSNESVTMTGEKRGVHLLYIYKKFALSAATARAFINSMYKVLLVVSPLLAGFVWRDSGHQLTIEQYTRVCIPSHLNTKNVLRNRTPSFHLHKTTSSYAHTHTHTHTLTQIPFYGAIQPAMFAGL